MFKDSEGLSFGFGRLILVYGCSKGEEFLGTWLRVVNYPQRSH